MTTLAEFLTTLRPGPDQSAASAGIVRPTTTTSMGRTFEEDCGQLIAVLAAERRGTVEAIVHLYDTRRHWIRRQASDPQQDVERVEAMAVRILRQQLQFWCAWWGGSEQLCGRIREGKEPEQTREGELRHE